MKRVYRQLWSYSSVQNRGSSSGIMSEGRRTGSLHPLTEALKGGDIAGLAVGDDVKVDVGKGPREAVLELEGVWVRAHAPAKVARGQGVAEAEDAQGLAPHG